MPICSFYGTFIKKADGIYKKHVYYKVMICLKGCGCCTPSPEQIVAKDRDFVKNKWSLPGRFRYDNDIDLSGFDTFLSEIKNNSFTITAMGIPRRMER